MIRKIRETWHGGLVRPLIHRSFTRVVWGVFLALLIAFFIRQSGGQDLRSELLLLWGVICLTCAWLTYLQMDGAEIVPLQKIRGLMDRKSQKKRTGDMIDYVDEEVQNYESLDDEEKLLVLMLADLINFVLFAVLSAVILLF